MSELENNVKVTWQLLSQFVSWEFCRYMSESNDTSTAETDVLTFLRKMIVQRTEKSVTDITKHEIVAKFIMETRAVQSMSGMHCIESLAESVKLICPELESIISKLVYHVETFLKNLEETNDEYRRELILLRISQAISEFSKESERLLPQPDLLQVVEAWKSGQNHVHKKSKKSVVYNPMLFEKVLECLHFEKITPEEAKLIAVALSKDKIFEKMTMEVESINETTEADSEQFSLSLQSSQQNEQIYSQEFGKNINLQKNLTSTQVKFANVPNTQLSDDFVSISQQIAAERPGLNDIQNPELPSSSVSDEFCPLMHRSISEINDITELQNNVPASPLQFAQSSTNDSSPNELSSALHDRINERLNAISIQRIQDQPGDSECDTSDCDKNPQFKFLTPTYYKKGATKTAPTKSQVVWLSDLESNNSTVITVPGNSQQLDPNWSTRQSNFSQSLGKSKRKCLRSHTQQLPYISDSDSDESLVDITDKPYQTKKKFNDAQVPASSRSAIPPHRVHNVTPVYVRKKPAKKKGRVLERDPGESLHNSPVGNQRLPPKKRLRVLESDSSESPHNSLVENQGNLLQRVQQIHTESQLEAERDLQLELRPDKKKKKPCKSVKLFRTPNRSLDDFIEQRRRPVPVATNEVPVHRGTNTPARKTPKTVKHLKVLKCKHCSRTFKTAVGLNRHVFLKHTNPSAKNNDSDVSDD